MDKQVLKMTNQLTTRVLIISELDNPCHKKGYTGNTMTTRQLGSIRDRQNAGQLVEASISGIVSHMHARKLEIHITSNTNYD